MQVKLETFGDFKVVVMAAVITAAAVIGKVVSGFVCPSRLSRLSVGVGMMPRGEVALIFAGVGKELGVIGDAMFSAIVITVMATTVLTPPLLRHALVVGFTNTITYSGRHQISERGTPSPTGDRRIPNSQSPLGEGLPHSEDFRFVMSFMTWST
jgi:Kef-type K+ transport system membrane component KefB